LSLTYNKGLLHSLVDALVKFGPVGVFLIGVLESFGVPIPAVLDALLVLVVWKSPSTAYITAAAATVGSVIGNILLFQTSRHGGRRFMKTPAPDAPQKFRRWFARYGLVTVFIPAMVPIPLPLKVFVISAGLFHTSFRNFLGVIVVARVVRYFGLAYLGKQLGEHAKEFLKQNAWNLVGISLVLGLIMYALVRFNDRRTVE
jgi:membrane protein YqaA with SNARE-associated domain